MSFMTKPMCGFLAAGGVFIAIFLSPVLGGMITAIGLIGWMNLVKMPIYSLCGGGALLIALGMMSFAKTDVQTAVQTLGSGCLSDSGVQEALSLLAVGVAAYVCGAVKFLRNRKNDK